MKKINRSHSSYIERAEKLLKFLSRNHLVSKVVLGIIVPKRPPARTHGKFKITVKDKYILLQVNSKFFNQKIHVYSKEPEKLVLEMTKFLNGKGLEVTFGKN